MSMSINREKKRATESRSFTFRGQGDQEELVTYKVEEVGE